MKEVLSRALLVVAAIGAGAMIILVSEGATDLILGQPLLGGTLLGDDWEAIVMRLSIASFPMIVLALIGSRSRTLWLTALILTSMFWAWFVWSIWNHSLNGFAGGADIGLGLVMLASPTLVFAGAGIAAAIRRGSDTPR